jgi:hypothetical protein
MITLASWALRPAERRVAAEHAKVQVSTIGWIVPLSVIAVFLVIALFTLPKGTSPF